MSDIAIIKNLLVKSKKTFDVALMAGNDEAVVNNYILGICNTLTTTPALLKCTPESIRDAAITSATLGVAIDARQYAYLIPYGNKAQFQLSYKGYVHVAKRDPDVDNITSNIVYEGDDFTFDIGGNTIHHMPDLDHTGYGNDNNIKFFYAVVRFKENTGRAPMFEVMTKKQVNDIMAKAKQKHIWNGHYGEMGRKTAIKRLCKHAQLGDVARFDQVDNAIHEDRIINLNPDGVVEAEDLLEKDKNKILEAIEVCVNQKELDEVFRVHSEKHEEIITYNREFSNEIGRANQKKKDQLYTERLEEAFEACESVESIDQVYEAHTVRIERFKAAERNELIQMYCDRKEILFNESIPQ